MNLSKKNWHSITKDVFETISAYKGLKEINSDLRIDHKVSYFSIRDDNREIKQMYYFKSKESVYFMSE